MALMNESSLQRRLAELENFVKGIGGDSAATVTSTTEAPTGLGNEGDIVFDQTTRLLYMYTDGSWEVTGSFTWIRYASEIQNILDDGTIEASGDAKGFTDTLNRNVKWIGEAFLQTKIKPSNSPTDYIWRLAPAGLITDAAIDEEVIPGPPKNLEITEELYQTNNAAGVKSKVKLTWDANVEAGFAPTATTLVEYKSQVIGTCDRINLETDNPFKIKSDCINNLGNWEEVGTTDDDFETLTETPNLYAVSLDIPNGVTDFRLTAISKLGVKSTSVIRPDFTITGVTSSPISPRNLTLSSNNTTAILTWDRSTELDVTSGGTVQIRIHPLTDASVSWSSAQVLVDALQGATTAKTVPLMLGTYLVKFVDSGGRYSKSASAVTNTFAPAGFNYVSTSDEHAAGYQGGKINCLINAGDLEKRDGGILTGTGSVSEGQEYISGTSTLFEVELEVGDWITIAGQKRKVTRIDSTTLLLVDTPFETAGSGSITRESLSLTYFFDGYENTDITGYITPVGTTVSGSGTTFLTDLSVGDTIVHNQEARNVTAISNDSSLTIDSAYTIDGATPVGTEPPADETYMYTSSDTTHNVNIKDLFFENGVDGATYKIVVAAGVVLTSQYNWSSAFWVDSGWAGTNSNLILVLYGTLSSFGGTVSNPVMLSNSTDFNNFDVYSITPGGFIGTVHTQSSCPTPQYYTSFDYDFIEASIAKSNVDLGEVKSVKVSPYFDAIVYKSTDQICTSDDVCNITSMCVKQEDAEIIFYISTSDDNAIWTPWVRLVAGNYNARSFRFKVIATVEDSGTLIDFQALRMDLDTVDIIKTGTTTTSTSQTPVTQSYTGSCNVDPTTNTTPALCSIANGVWATTPPFYKGVDGTTLPRIGTQVTGGSAGDTVVISSNSATSFDVTVWNNNSRVVRTVDWQAIGQ